MAQPARQSEAALRRVLKVAARQAFCLERRPITLDALLLRDEFESLDIETLEAWSLSEDWPSLRRDNLREWQLRAEARVTAAIDQRSQRQLDYLKHLHGEAVRLRSMPSTKPRSWEQVAAIELKTAEMYRKWHKEDAEERRKVLAEMRQAQGTGSDQPMGDLTEQEVQATAHFILSQRIEGAEGAAPLNSNVPEGPVVPATAAKVR